MVCLGAAPLGCTSQYLSNIPFTGKSGEREGSRGDADFTNFKINVNYLPFSHDLVSYAWFLFPLLLSPKNLNDGVLLSATGF